MKNRSISRGALAEELLVPLGLLVPLIGENLIKTFFLPAEKL